MRSSLVGASTERLRTALQIIDAVSQRRMLFIATCNSIASLPPELWRRFTLGTFFFDLPTANERENSSQGGEAHQEFVFEASPRAHRREAPAEGLDGAFVSGPDNHPGARSATPPESGGD